MVNVTASGFGKSHLEIHLFICFQFSHFMSLLILFSSRRQKIIKEKAVPKIEGYMFEEHDLVRASATECMCNLVLSTEVILIYLQAKTVIKI